LPFAPFVTVLPENAPPINKLPDWVVVVFSAFTLTTIELSFIAFNNCSASFDNLQFPPAVFYFSIEKKKSGWEKNTGLSDFLLYASEIKLLRWLSHGKSKSN